MSFEYFIANKILKSKEKGIKVSRPILRISLISVALTIIVNLITLAVVHGFQSEIRNKIVGFNAPIFLMKAGNDNIYEADVLKEQQNIIEDIEKIDGVKNTSPVLYKPALLRSDKFEDTLEHNGKSEILLKQEVNGVVLKGINESYPIDFLKSILVEGSVPSFGSDKNEVLISKKLCEQLHFKVEDEIAIFFVKNRSLMQRFKIKGIFETGIEKLDQQIVFSPLKKVQELSDFADLNKGKTNFVSGFEIQITDWNSLEETGEELKNLVELVPNENGTLLQTKSILDSENDIFSWLGFLDTNVLIIITLMILIGIVNIGSVLLVMIVVRSNFIGVMKALGASNWSIRKIFLMQTAFLIFKAMVIGNIIGLGLCFLQYHFQWIQLDANIYYLSHVPIKLTVLHVVFINAITFVTCVLSLLIPSYVISRISPATSIKFN
ncbi:MAG: FtsX-like permease family protein [Crocinitomicaceae bacterium]